MPGVGLQIAGLPDPLVRCADSLCGSQIEPPRTMASAGSSPMAACICAVRMGRIIM